VNVLNSCIESIKNIGSLTFNICSQMPKLHVWNLMEVCNVHGSVSNQHPCFLTNVKDRKTIRLAINLAEWESACPAEHHKHRDCKIWPCGTKFILIFYLYLAYKRISFYIKITTYHLSFKFESQNEDRWTNFVKIFIFLLFPMLLTENTTNDTCQSNVARGNDVARGHR
jgi:hypothetical protein